MPIYFDNNATTPISHDVFDVMVPYFTGIYGNPSSSYCVGQLAKKGLDEARNNIARLLKVSPEGIIFTSSGSEADNTALKSVSRHFKNTKKNILVTSKIEHHAILNSMQTLESDGFEIVYLNVNKNGLVDVKQLEKLVLERGDSIALVSIMGANNEIGTIEPVEKIGEFLHKHNIIFHVDAVQSFGWMGLPKNCDMASISGHKIHAPKGIGILYINNSFEKNYGFYPKAFIDGGKQEFGIRGGTENVPYIIGMSKAITDITENRQSNIDTVSNLKALILEYVLSEIPDAKLNSPRLSLPNTLNFSFKGIDGAALLEYLNLFGICTSTGSACNTGSVEPSHVLKAIGLSNPDAFASLRISLGSQNNELEVHLFCDTLKNGVSHLRKISGYST